MFRRPDVAGLHELWIRLPKSQRRDGMTGRL
jgi:hypothetical protein